MKIRVVIDAPVQVGGGCQLKAALIIGTRQYLLRPRELPRSFYLGRLPVPRVATWCGRRITVRSPAGAPPPSTKKPPVGEVVDCDLRHDDYRGLPCCAAVPRRGGVLRGRSAARLRCATKSKSAGAITAITAIRAIWERYDNAVLKAARRRAAWSAEGVQCRGQ